MAVSSRISGFYKLSRAEKIAKVKDIVGLTTDEVAAIERGYGSLDELANIAENVIGAIGIPLGIATNFMINGKDYLIPMASEEPSVVAACSNGARMVRESGGFFTSSTEPIMDGQIQVVGIRDPQHARISVLQHKDELIAMANTQDPILVETTGGACDVVPRIVQGFTGTMLIVHLSVNVGDAMGANAVNRMAEHIAPRIEELTGGRVYLRVIDNYCGLRLARAYATVKKEVLGGERVVDGIIYGYDCAYSDTHRAVGHNKGTMNGVSAVVLATGNDTRAVECAFHAHAAKSGQYRAMPVWEKNANGDLSASIEIPAPVGLVGGATKAHAVARAAVKILGVQSSRELGEVLAAVALAQKLAAERALADEGIELGHTKSRARVVAVEAGAKGDEVEEIAKAMIDEGKVRADRAKELVAQRRKK
jgi:hydroxymethylglutaryl-CoA reductase